MGTSCCGWLAVLVCVCLFGGGLLVICHGFRFVVLCLSYDGDFGLVL